MKKIKVEMTQVEYEEFKKWKSLSSFTFQKMTKDEFYEFVKSQVPKDLIDDSEISQSDSLETFVDAFSYIIMSNVNKPNVEFDLENFDCSNEWSHVKTGWDKKHGWLSFMSGGDWEIPIFGILYNDGSKLQCYIPQNGNCYNAETMMAWQEEPESFKGKDVKELYDLDLMVKDILYHFNLDEE